MDQTVLIEDIITTKNTLTILYRVFNANKISLQQFSSIFDSIAELINILTHSSATEIETTLISTGSKFISDALKDTLNELSDAITTGNTSTINSLNEQLHSCAQKLRIRSSHATDNEETADNIFKKQLLQQQLVAKGVSQPVIDESMVPRKCTCAEANFDLKSDMAPKAPDRFELEQEQEESPSIDLSIEPAFKRQRHTLTSSEKNTNLCDLVRSSPSLTAKSRLMISYNHASKSLCLDIYNNLTNDGYNVWIDLEQMHGNTLVAMAQGIENSDIILYCVTEQYSLSPYCQKEAEYAFVQQKIMIPLLLQSKYKPKDWLGLLLGASLYIDFTKN